MTVTTTRSTTPTTTQPADPALVRGPHRSDRSDWCRGPALGAKFVLAALLLHALVFAHLPQYQDKAMGYRLVAYPLIACVVPIAWALRRVRDGRRAGGGGAGAGRLPWAVDLCVTLPFLFDLAGNSANLYDTVEWWDDAMHVATWIPWVVTFGLLARRRVGLDRLVLGALVVGFGAVTHVIWELAEYLSFVADHPTESLSAYRDTMGDFALSLVGSVIGATAVARAGEPAA